MYSVPPTRMIASVTVEPLRAGDASSSSPCPSRPALPLDAGEPQVEALCGCCRFAAALTVTVPVTRTELAASRAARASLDDRRRRTCRPPRSAAAVVGTGRGWVLVPLHAASAPAAAVAAAASRIHRIRRDVPTILGSDSPARQVLGGNLHACVPDHSRARRWWPRRGQSRELRPGAGVLRPARRTAGPRPQRRHGRAHPRRHRRAPAARPAAARARAAGRGLPAAHLRHDEPGHRHRVRRGGARIRHAELAAFRAPRRKRRWCSPSCSTARSPSSRAAPRSPSSTSPWSSRAPATGCSRRSRSRRAAAAAGSMTLDWDEVTGFALPEEGQGAANLLAAFEKLQARRPRVDAARPVRQAPRRGRRRARRRAARRRPRGAARGRAGRAASAGWRTSAPPTCSRPWARTTPPTCWATCPPRKPSGCSS